MNRHRPSPGEAHAGSAPHPRTRSGFRGLIRGLGRDYAYVLPGLPLAVIGFAVLLTLTLVSISTLVVWVGVVLLPFTLLVASVFAGLSRGRLRVWSGIRTAPGYRPTRPGVAGLLRAAADPRRWLDLVFETLIAFPLRLATFVVAAVWSGVAAGGLTSWIWAWFVWTDGSVHAGWIGQVAPALVPDDTTGRILVEVAGDVVVGVVAALTLPWVMRGLAAFDAMVAGALLGGVPDGGMPDGSIPEGGMPVGGVPEGGMPVGGVPPERARRAAAERVAAPAGPQPVGAASTTGAATRTAPADPHPAGASTDAVLSVAGWAWACMILVAVPLVAAGWPLLSSLYGVPVAIAMLLVVGHSVAPILAVRWAPLGLGLSVAAMGGTIAATAAAAHAGILAAPWPWPVTMLLGHLALLLILALRHHWMWTAAAWAAAAVLTIVGYGVGGFSTGVADGIVALAISAGVGILGLLIRQWARRSAQVRRAERLTAEEVRRRRDLEERSRIAREMHDIVAHSMSVISVQASTVQYRESDVSPEVQRELDEIAGTSRQALGEMRTLLGALRDDEAAPTSPVPTLADIADLVESTRASGVVIDYAGTEAEVPARVGVTAYRIVQEGLSNALRHAPGAAVDIVIGVDPAAHALAVRVANSAATRASTALPGAGFGLAGIRERAALLGGGVRAEPMPGGGFAVSASLPLGRDAA